MHAGVSPYECKVCPRRFAQSGNLNEHLRTHASKTPMKAISVQSFSVIPAISEVCLFRSLPSCSYLVWRSSLPKLMRKEGDVLYTGLTRN
ncbi:unnamed protein product [Cyprideis torosa]|uniref:Uncharacterized protein n=1 Tax=Cyprideis torosa TaxID=163714 RepID=A0A7R8W940_9CRUS|nr:unnamed protein product [Cyprideis torosa]CAG0889351.1 unnamed protein product [Cyprideis torosa]